MTTEEEINIKSKEIQRLRGVCRTKDEALSKAIDRIKVINLLLPPRVFQENTALIEELNEYLG